MFTLIVAGKLSVIEPAPFVTSTWLVVPVSVALVSVLPVVLPINNSPFVYVVWPVPPLATASVPPKVTAPVVAVFGVSPVVPALNELTKELDTVPHDGAAPVLPTKTWPVVPAAVTPTGDVPLPYKTPLAVNVISPVPPAATGNVPATKAEADVEYKA